MNNKRKKKSLNRKEIETQRKKYQGKKRNREEED